MIQRNSDNRIVEEAGDLPVPSHQGSAGGDLAREVGKRDEARQATGDDSEPTRVVKADKRDQGDRPTPPQTRE